MAGALWALAGLAPAKDLFVNNTAGDDTFTGKLATTASGMEGPVRTLAKALRLATAGDRIVLANTGQPYRECVALQGNKNSGNGVWPLVIDGQGATLDGSAAIPGDSWELVADDVFRFRPRRQAFHLVFQGDETLVRRATPRPGSAWSEALDEKQWTLTRGHAYVRLPARAEPSDHELRHTAHPVGITLHRVWHVVIANLRVRGYQLDGISLPEGVRDCQLVNVVCEANGRAGVAVGGTSRVDLVRCTLKGNGVAQLWAADRSQVALFQPQFDPQDGPNRPSIPVNGDSERVRIFPERESQ